MQHFADRLSDAVRNKGNAVCVGLDPRWESLPADIRRGHNSDSLEGVAAAFEAFCGRVLDITAPLVPVVKPQAAFFEVCGPAGMTNAVLASMRELKVPDRQVHAEKFSLAG